MSQAQQQQQKERRTFSDWYEENKDNYNRKRKKRYKEDAEYRASQIKNARLQKEYHRNYSENDFVTRNINGKKVKLYRISAAASLIGRSADTIRTWERNGWIPKSFYGAQRLYSMKKINLMKQFVESTQKYRYVKNYNKKLEQLIARLHKKW